MKRRWYAAYCLIAFALLALACGCARDGGSENLFRDDFDNPRSGWGTAEQEGITRGYEDGGYVIELRRPNWFAWASPGEQVEDTSIEVDAQAVSGPQDNHFGVVCRQVNLDNFYYFAISSDGFYGIFRRLGGGDMEILSGDRQHMTPSDAIKVGREANHLVAVCQGAELSLYVNGQLLETVTDFAHARGDVGLGAGSGAESGVRVQFDNFIVARQ